EKKSVGFELGIPPGSMTIEEDSGKINFDVVVVVRAAGGTEVTHVNQQVERKLSPENIADIKARGINYKNKIDLAPATYGVWFVVRDNLTGRTGSVVVPLKISESCLTLQLPAWRRGQFHKPSKKKSLAESEAFLNNIRSSKTKD